MKIAVVREEEEEEDLFCQLIFTIPAWKALNILDYI